jgi:hypothetical protein
MISPGPLPLVAQRHVPFVYEIECEFDLTGATLDMHIRLLPDTPGAALVDLSPAAAGLEGLSMVHAAGYSTITIQIDEATMEDEDKIPPANEPGEDVVLYYDLHVTPSGGVKAVYFAGTFTVEPGVTF